MLGRARRRGFAVDAADLDRRAAARARWRACPCRRPRRCRPRTPTPTPTPVPTPTPTPLPVQLVIPQKIARGRQALQRHPGAFDVRGRAGPAGQPGARNRRQLRARPAICDQGARRRRARRRKSPTARPRCSPPCPSSAALLDKAEVSKFYFGIYQNKTELLRQNLTHLDALLPRDTFLRHRHDPRNPGPRQQAQGSAHPVRHGRGQRRVRPRPAARRGRQPTPPSSR